ncbi:FadR/GntR family transcriptional regulator [Paenibacillus allorhizosphaerae]|uniref:L-lactate dehydrogenase operon regulatory protein n=1 Tax=Paenibacillus allorhizosphaerae TaxID=2849866 RepID=A0ABM8VPN5_9BACL|nr:FadR/GntR family transcriptional regulator [Paenibacillus allorhizosphaerae]CAG7653175.1 Putative L-lactate dehydrogenase operon regulatory protein [Paenibacillus allorhizosphaerae]
MLKKTTRHSLVDQVIIQIEALIERGQWPVGSKIPPEPELVAELNVSRNTLREGIKALCHAGVLCTKQGDGTYVRSNSTLGVAIQRRVLKSSLLDTLEVRYALEREAARLSADRRTEEDVQRIQGYQQECNALAEEGDMHRYVAADMKLHLAIVEASGNPMLMELYGHITEAIQESISMHLDKTFGRGLPENKHVLLVEAIIGKDAEAAAQAVRQHIDELKKAIEMGEI